MAASASLPPSLRHRLNAVARRLRLMRLVYGLSVLVLGLTLTAAACLAADAFLHLDAAVRLGLLLGWVGLGALTALFAVVLPLFRRLDPAALAAFVEERYPELAERLTSAVELAGERGVHHGSPALIDLLMAETADRTERLRVARAVRMGLVAALTVTAVVVLTGALAPAAVWPHKYAELGTRFLAPWYTPPVVLDYGVEAVSGDVFVGRGRPLTLVARVVALKDEAALPGDCTLVIAAGGLSRSVEMKPSEDGESFTAELDAVAGDFTYFVESGQAKSDTFTVTAVEPVALAPESPTTTVTPPEYARDTIKEATFNGLVSLTALQHSRVKVELKFTRPAQWALLTWTNQAAEVSTKHEYKDYVIRAIGDKDAPPMDKFVLGKLTALDAGVVAGTPGGQNGFRLSKRGFDPVDDKALVALFRDLGDVQHPVTLAEDGLSGTVELDAVSGGSFRLLMMAEHDVTTTSDPVTLTVNADQPPAFHKVSLSDQLKAVLPSDRVPLEFTVVDDVGVAGALLEYRVNDGQVASEAISLTGANTREATGKHALALSGKVKEGDEVHFRLKALDNRRVPEKNLGPQETYYPEKGWLTLKVASSAKPLKEQGIVAQRDAVNKKLDKIWDELRHEQRGLYNLRQESKKEAALNPENLNKLKELRQENRTAEDDLRELARDAAQTPELQKLADAAQDLAEQEMHRAADGLKQSEKGNKPEPREEKLQKVDGELDRAMAKIEELRKANEQVAKQRIDQAKLEAAAQKEKDLADRAKELADKKDADPKDAKELQKEQGDLANELQKLADQSDALRNALDAARGEQAKELADKARELAKEQRDLAEANKDDPKRQQQLAELARKQQELADKAAKLAKETQSAAKAAQANPLKPEDAQKAAENLKQGDAGEAVKNQDQAAKDLDRLAEQLDKALDLAKDPREAAKQLARMEQDLQQRLADELAKKNDPKPLADRLNELQKEQDAIRKAAENLDVPEQNRQAQTDQKNAANRSAEASQSLKSNPRNAQVQMEQARQALDQLSKDLPSLEQRQQAARDALAQLRQQQQNTEQLAEQALKPFEKDDPNSAKTKQALAEKLAEARKKQAEAAEKLSKLDAPGFEKRQEKAENALDQALRDLMEGRSQDIPASQAAAKRELERLEQALQGKTPADEQAQKLAEEQQKLAEDAAKAAGDPKANPQQLAELQKKQQELAREAQKLQAPEAPQRQDEAAKATQQAEQAAKANPVSPESQKKMQDAAKALQKLAEQMAGQEPEADKAERLARKQQKAAAEAEKLAQQQKPPTPDMQDELKRLSRETKDLRGGDEAQAEKKRALDALNQAQQAKPEDQPKAQQKAADALRDLADKLAGRDTPAEKAAELARQQRDLAKEAQKPDGQPSPEKQQELERQLDRLDAKGAEEARKQAREQMEQARKALEQGQKPGDAKDQLGKAADAAEKLARELGEKQAAQPKPQDQPQNQQAAKPGDSPQKMAQQLADKQRDLMKQTQKARDDLGFFPGEKDKKKFNDAMDRIEKEQAQLNKQASQLPADGQQKTLEQARQSMDQADQALGKKDGYQAQSKQREAADALQKLALNLPKQQPNNAQAQQQPQQGPLNKEQSQQARDLAQQQRDLRDQAQQLAQQKPANQQEQSAKQQDLQKKTTDLMQDLQKLAQQMSRQPQPQQQADQAARQTQQAGEQMKQAEQQAQQGNQGQQRQAQQQAAQSLEQAARQAQQAGEQMARQQQGQQPGQQQAGQAMQQAERQMQQAQKQLGQGQPQDAQGAMQQAAQMLKQAAQQLGQQSSQQAKNQPQQPGQPMQNTEPGDLGASGEGRVDASMLGPDMKKYAGKRWGDLPGELQTKILQDMKARYGDDYARIIKLYFEQLADTKRK